MSGHITTSISQIDKDIHNYNNSSDPKFKASDLYSNAITAKIKTLNENIDKIDVLSIAEQSWNIGQNIRDTTELIIKTKADSANSPNNIISKQKEVDILRGRIDNSKLVNSSRIFIYIVYIIITLIIIGGLIYMFWFPNKGILNIFISIMAVLILLVSFY